MKKRRDFNTTKEYIEYLIYKENVLNIKNVALVLLLIGALAVITIQFSGNFRTLGIEGLPISIDEKIDALLKAGYSQEEVEQFSKDEINAKYTEIFLNNKGQMTGLENYSEYPEQDASILKQDYYMKASVGDFDYIISDFNDKKLKYKFSTSYNKELITIYNDAYYLKTIIKKNDINSFKVNEVLSNIKNARMLLFGTLLTEEKYRRDVFIDKFSLSPILLNKQINVTSEYSASMASASKKKEDKRLIEMANYLNNGDYIFYKLDFTIDNNSLTAYLYKNLSDFKLSMYGIYSNNKDNPYLTVYDFIQMDSSSLENNSSEHSSNSNSTQSSNLSSTESSNTQEDSDINQEESDGANSETNNSFTGNNEVEHSSKDETSINNGDNQANINENIGDEEIATNDNLNSN